jgi:hypothetical protein
MFKCEYDSIVSIMEMEDKIFSDAMVRLSRAMSQEIFDNIHAQGIARLSVPPSQIGEGSSYEEDDAGLKYL